MVATKKKNISLSEYEKLLRVHDWLFEDSDDNSVWQAGFDNHRKLEEIAKQSKEHRKLFNDYREVRNPLYKKPKSKAAIKKKQSRPKTLAKKTTSKFSGLNYTKTYELVEDLLDDMIDDAVEGAIDRIIDNSNSSPKIKSKARPKTKAKIKTKPRMASKKASISKSYTKSAVTRIPAQSVYESLKKGIDSEIIASIPEKLSEDIADISNTLMHLEKRNRKIVDVLKKLDTKIENTPTRTYTPREPREAKPKYISPTMPSVSPKSNLFAHYGHPLKKKVSSNRLGDEKSDLEKSAEFHKQIGKDLKAHAKMLYGKKGKKKGKPSFIMRSSVWGHYAPEYISHQDRENLHHHYNPKKHFRYMDRWERPDSIWEYLGMKYRNAPGRKERVIAKEKARAAKFQQQYGLPYNWQNMRRFHKGYYEPQSVSEWAGYLTKMGFDKTILYQRRKKERDAIINEIKMSQDANYGVHSKVADLLKRGFNRSQEARFPNDSLWDKIKNFHRKTPPIEAPNESRTDISDLDILKGKDKHAAVAAFLAKKAGAGSSSSIVDNAAEGYLLWKMAKGAWKWAAGSTALATGAKLAIRGTALTTIATTLKGDTPEFQRGLEQNVYDRKKSISEYIKNQKKNPNATKQLSSPDLKSSQDDYLISNKDSGLGMPEFKREDHTYSGPKNRLSIAKQKSQYKSRISDLANMGDESAKKEHDILKMPEFKMDNPRHPVSSGPKNRLSVAKNRKNRKNINKDLTSGFSQKEIDRLRGFAQKDPFDWFTIWVQNFFAKGTKTDISYKPSTKGSSSNIINASYSPDQGIQQFSTQQNTYIPDRKFGSGILGGGSPFSGNGNIPSGSPGTKYTPNNIFKRSGGSGRSFEDAETSAKRSKGIVAGGPQGGALGPSLQPGQIPSTTSGMKGSITTNKISPEARALLDTISSTESGQGENSYHMMYRDKPGQGSITDMSHHPHQGRQILSGPNADRRTSSAAGRYQFLGSTWDDIAKRYGIKDFSPESQDLAAWYLAQENYKKKTGRDLNSDLKSKNPEILAGIGKALNKTWTSLPGGIETGTNTDKFINTFQKHVASINNANKGDSSFGDQPKVAWDQNVSPKTQVATRTNPQAITPQKVTKSDPRQDDKAAMMQELQNIREQQAQHAKQLASVQQTPPPKKSPLDINSHSHVPPSYRKAVTINKNLRKDPSKNTQDLPFSDRFFVYDL
jgi:muramidase (phage lysozyme)